MRPLVLLGPLLVLAGCEGNDPALVPGGDAGPGGGGAPAANGGAPSGTVALPKELPVEDVLGDGTADGVELVALYRAPPGRVATDLDWNPVRPDELWVVFRQLTDDTPCNRPAPGTRADPACSRLGGIVAILGGADSATPEVAVLQDPNAWHFMRLPPGIAFGPEDTFATCGEARTGNFDDEPADYMGPTLWSSDPEIFAIEPPGKNGSHLDMLHATPFCSGIAHERERVYWLFNGDAGALDRYDFGEPHEIGGDDHSDGQASRWALGEVRRVPGVPSHLVYDPRDGTLYVADTGNGRVIAVDTGSGENAGAMPTDDEQMPGITRRTGATVTEIVPPGDLEAPSGVALAGDTLYVTDNASSRIVALDRSGTVRASLDTGLPPGTLAGISIGPDGKAYLADVQRGVVRRVEAR